jgi:rare lipoprotein A
MKSLMLVGLMGLCSTVSAENGKATYYSKASCIAEGNSGVYTSSGERYDEGALTAAYWNVPFGTKLKVTNLDNGKSIVVRVNDRGPSKRLVKQGKIIDLSPKSYDLLGGKRGVNKRGVAWGEIEVTVERL